MPAPRPSPTVSVIIPAYNAAQWITDAVRSALAQSQAPHQVIVIDDGSTDNTLELLALFADRITVVSQPNRGVAAARNHALQLATGDYIAFLDADDLWHPRKLEFQLAALAQHPTTGVLGTRTFDCSTTQAQHAPAATVTTIPLRQLCIKNYLTTSSIMIRRDLARRVGEFDPSLQGPEDHDFWIRAAELAPVAILEAPLTGYRVVPGSLSRRATTMEHAVRRILQKLENRYFWRAQPLLRRHAYAYAACASSFLHADEGHPGRALLKLLESLAWYPLPLSRAEVGTPLLRPRRLAALLKRLIGELFAAPAASRRPPTQPLHRPHHPVPDRRADDVQPQLHPTL
jgi:glycosyltransferase involved in cell wall biosynthesis